MSEIRWYLFFLVWLIPLGVTPFRSVHNDASGRPWHYVGELFCWHQVAFLIPQLLWARSSGVASLSLSDRWQDLVSCDLLVLCHVGLSTETPTFSWSRATLDSPVFCERPPMCEDCWDTSHDLGRAPPPHFCLPTSLGSFSHKPQTKN